MFRKFAFATLLSLIALPAMAGNSLFPPDNRPSGNCPGGTVLTWTGHSVECVDPSPGVSTLNGGCGGGSYMTDISGGNANCSSTGIFVGCAHPTLGNSVWSIRPEVITSSSSSGFPISTTRTTVTVNLINDTFLGFSVLCDGAGASGEGGVSSSKSTSSTGTQVIKP